MYAYFEKCVIKATEKINTETKRIEAKCMSVIHGNYCVYLAVYIWLHESEHEGLTTYWTCILMKYSNLFLIQHVIPYYFQAAFGLIKVYEIVVNYFIIIFSAIYIKILFIQLSFNYF